MSLRVLIPALIAVPLLTVSAWGQPVAPGEGPADISADDFELFDNRGLIVYSGDVNVVRGDVRLRADRLEAYFVRRSTGGRELQRIEAEGDVFYITESEIARGDAGIYNLVDETIELTGSVVLTQGCNVSTGQHLYAEITTGVARLDGGEGSNERVRSVFFTDENGAAADSTQTCETPVIPGDGPRPFEGE